MSGCVSLRGRVTTQMLSASDSGGIDRPMHTLTLVYPVNRTFNYIATHSSNNCSLYILHGPPSLGPYCLIHYRLRSRLLIACTPPNPDLPIDQSIPSTSLTITMAPSKFVEILDVSDTPFSQNNVSLDDILEDKRHRSNSQSSGRSQSTAEKSSAPTSPTTGTVPQTPFGRLRGFTLKKKT